MESFRLDFFLSLRKDFSRNFYQKFVKEVGVKINGKIIKKPHFTVKLSDKIEIDEEIIQKYFDKSNQIVFKDFANFKIIYKGKGFIVIDKPAYVTTEEITKNLYPIHRLDKNTSGILVVADNAKTQHDLQRQWQDRTVSKKYCALIKGELLPKEGAIEAPISRSYKDRMKMAVSSSISAKSAITLYEVKEKYSIEGGSFCLVNAFPKTGRTHQIRVHFSSIKHPIIGDDMYGDNKWNEIFEVEFNLNRQFLHAESLTMADPATGEKITFHSSLPSDLSQILDTLKKSNNCKKDEK